VIAQGPRRQTAAASDRAVVVNKRNASPSAKPMARSSHARVCRSGDPSGRGLTLPEERPKSTDPWQLSFAREHPAIPSMARRHAQRLHRRGQRDSAGGVVWNRPLLGSPPGDRLGGGPGCLGWRESPFDGVRFGARRAFAGLEALPGGHGARLRRIAIREAGHSLLAELPNGPADRRVVIRQPWPASGASTQWQATNSISHLQRQSWQRRSAPLERCSRPVSPLENTALWQLQRRRR